MLYDRNTSLPRKLSTEGKSVEGNITDDGRWVTFLNSNALDAADTNNQYDLYLIDTQESTPHPKLLSLSPLGKPLPNGCLSGMISGDGNYYAFTTKDDLTSDDRDGSEPDAYLVNRATGSSSTVLASKVTGSGYVGIADMSSDGKYLVFEWTPTSGTTTQPLLYDSSLKAVKTLFLTYKGGTPGASMSYPSIAGNGAWIAIASSATNLVPNDANGVADVFVLPQ